MQCFSEFEYLLGTQASRLIFTNKMALEPSKNKKENYWETKTLYFFNNIPLIDIFSSRYTESHGVLFLLMNHLLVLLSIS